MTIVTDSILSADSAATVATQDGDLLIELYLFYRIVLLFFCIKLKKNSWSMENIACNDVHR